MVKLINHLAHLISLLLLPSRDSRIDSLGDGLEDSSQLGINNFSLCPGRDMCICKIIRNI